jgi:ComF family protein
MDAAAILLNALFPAECVACGAGILRGALCDACRLTIAPHRDVFCGACGAPLPFLRNLCHPDVPYLLGAAGEYGDPSLRALIHALKFGRMRTAAGPLADILAHYIARLPVDLRGMTVVPVPISTSRMRERGFNQAALIAERIAHFFGLPYEKNFLMRSVHRPPQSEIDDRDARHRNIEGCYAIAYPQRRFLHAPSRTEAPRKVMLIDDVTTSGATFTEAARTLRAAGTKKILALAVAKAVRSRRDPG